MKFTDLEPKFVQYEKVFCGEPMIKPVGGDFGTPYEHKITHVDDIHIDINNAHGVWFLCPTCFKRNGGAVGTHLVDVTFAGRGVPDDLGSHSREGAPSRWSVSGTGLDDLTLTPSVDITPGCDWHGWIKNGEVT